MNSNLFLVSSRPSSTIRCIVPLALVFSSTLSHVPRLVRLETSIANQLDGRDDLRESHTCPVKP